MTADPFALSTYQYHLPEELIAQTPCVPRDHSRLMIVDRSKELLTEIKFKDLVDFLTPNDHLIFNDTKVIPSRLIGKRASGGTAEIFLINRCCDGTWEALARPGKKLPPNSHVHFAPNFSCEIIENLTEGTKKIRFHNNEELDLLLEKWGQIPLPQYIKRTPSEQDSHQYQTVYATNPGACAAPTAGLHFTHDLLQKISQKNILRSNITLHVGLGTFRPVKVDDIRQHQIHKERCVISSETAAQLNRSHKRRIAIGTTCCRALESATNDNGLLSPGEFETSIYIYPGYKFKFINSLLTNFHLPGSTLLMLVSAFAGHELIMEAYSKAVKDKFRFFSYGDAMLIV